MPPRKRLNVFVISDGTGATAESVLTSVVIQFRGAQFNIKRFPFTRTEEQIKDIMKTAPKGKCIVVFTLVSEKLRKLVIKESKLCISAFGISPGMAFWMFAIGVDTYTPATYYPCREHFNTSILTTL